MHLSAMVLLDMPIAYDSAGETEGEEGDREREGADGEERGRRIEKRDAVEDKKI